MKDKRMTKMQKKWENEQKCESQTWPYEGCGLRPNFGLRMRVLILVKENRRARFREGTKLV